MPSLIVWVGQPKRTVKEEASHAGQKVVVEAARLDARRARVANEVEATRWWKDESVMMRPTPPARRPS